jgi:hypothetical protein
MFKIFKTQKVFGSRFSKIDQNDIVWSKHGASKKKIFNIEISGLAVKNAKKKKKIFCAFNDQFKQIFFVGGS